MFLLKTSACNAIKVVNIIALTLIAHIRHFIITTNCFLQF